MSDFQHILEGALHLTPAEQWRLIERLWDELPEDAPAAWSPEWLAEIARRSDEYDAGGVQTVPWTEIRDAAARRASST